MRTFSVSEQPECEVSGYTFDACTPIILMWCKDALPSAVSVHATSSVRTAGGHKQAFAATRELDLTSIYAASMCFTFLLSASLQMIIAQYYIPLWVVAGLIF